MPASVTIIDYGMGNLWSVRSGLSYLGCKFDISQNPSEIEKADTLILPGVGSFHQAMQTLRKLRLDQAILQAVSVKKRKILGICLGMQLFTESSTEEIETAGLGLMPVCVERFDQLEKRGLKIPHVGFDDVVTNERSTLFSGIVSPSDFYFVHSYRALPENLPGICATCQYGENFLAAYEHENVFATQFHPEKSQTNGLRLLKNFLTV
jgi:glutamine amidotransferase